MCIWSVFRYAGDVLSGIPLRAIVTIRYFWIFIPLEKTRRGCGYDRFLDRLNYVDFRKLLSGFARSQTGWQAYLLQFALSGEQSIIFRQVSEG